MNHPLLIQAREAIAAHLHGHPRRPPAGPPTVPSRGCFVSLKLSGRLRGCIGTVEPTQRDLEAEVAVNAVAAATRDPRFQPLDPAEFRWVTLSIDLLTPLQPIASLADHDVTRHGLLVRGGRRVGVLLPDLPGVRTARQQLEICLEKAGLEQDASYHMERFEVERFSE